MILVDTSIWIDFFRNNNPALSERLIEYLESGTAIGLSTVFGELLQGARAEDEERTIMEFWNNIPRINEENLFLEAGRLSDRYKFFAQGVGLIDCHFLAAAKIYNLNIWTLDKKLLESYTQLIN